MNQLQKDLTNLMQEKETLKLEVKQLQETNEELDTECENLKSALSIAESKANNFVLNLFL